jgi:hypothetical protein
MNATSFHPATPKSSHSFTSILLIGYLVLFHAWVQQTRIHVLAVGLVGIATLCTLFLLACQHAYFLNAWDAGFHAAVLLDLTLECVLIPDHHGFGFYVCAAAFALLLFGYRYRASHHPHARFRPCPTGPPAVASQSFRPIASGSSLPPTSP